VPKGEAGCEARVTLPVVNALLGDRITLLTRKPDGTVGETRERAEHCFFLRREDVTEQLRRQLRGEDGVTYDEREAGWVRVCCRSWIVRKEVVHRYSREGLTVYEGNVSPVRRLFADRADLVVQRPRRCYLDLETDSRVPFSKKEEMRILVWCVADDEGPRIVSAGVLDEDDDASERELLKRLFSVLLDYDQVLVWNGERFDFEVLKARMQWCGWNPAQLKRWLLLDQMVLFKRMNMHSAESGEEKRSFSLNSIAQAKLGEGKDSFDAKRTYEAWEAGGARLEELVRYCAQDTLLLPKLERKTGYADLHFSVCELCKVFPDTRGLFPSVLVDGLMFDFARGKGVRYPTKGDGVELDQAKGAFVMPPGVRGIGRDVHVVDFASMYPSIVTTWNLGLDTRRHVNVNGPIQEGHCRAPTTRAGYVTDTPGIFASAVAKVGELRVSSKRLEAGLPPGTPEWHEAHSKSTAYKVVHNSFPGVLGLDGGRFHDRVVFESVTGTGEWLLKQTIAAAEKRGMRCVYGDTDSVYLTGVTREEMREFAAWCNAELYPRITKEQGCVRCDLVLEYEKAYSRIVFVAAKKYVGRYAHAKGKDWTEKSKPEIKGMEYMRGDAGLLTARLQAEVIDLLVGGLKVARAPTPSDDIADYVEVVERHRRHVLEEPLPVEEVQQSKGLNREVHQYARKTKKDGTKQALPIQAQIAEQMAEAGDEVHAGIKVAWVVVDAEAKRYVPASQYTGEVDRLHLWNNSVWPATERLLAAAFPDEDWARFRVRRERQARQAAKGKAGQAGLFG
jgi:DNA polymerase elongation subunit (family B)